MRKEYGDRIAIHPADYEDLATVDSKLVRLAQELNSTLITNDFNLNKVATFQQVSVLNINDLAQALRPNYLPGTVSISRCLRKARSHPKALAIWKMALW